MSFFRANLIGLKADRDKKEIGTAVSISKQSGDDAKINNTGTPTFTFKTSIY